MRFIVYKTGAEYLNIPDGPCCIITLSNEARFDTIVAKCALSLGYGHDDVPASQLYLLPEGVRARNRDDLQDGDRLALFVASTDLMEAPSALLHAAMPVLQARTAQEQGAVASQTSSVLPVMVQPPSKSESEALMVRVRARGKAAQQSRGLAHFPGEVVAPKERFRRAVRRVMFLNRIRRMAASTPKVKSKKRSGVARSLDGQIKHLFHMYEYAHQRSILDDESEKLPPGILHPERGPKIVWDIAMLVLVVFFAFAVPYRIGFDVELSKAEEDFDFVADVLFIGDILISFRTAYFEKGVLVTDWRQIGADYLRAWFPIDALASFPIGWIVTDGGGAGKLNKLFRMLRLFKLFRILRLLKLFPRVMVMLESAIKLNPAMLRFLRSFVALFMLWHFIGAAYFFAAREEYGGTAACVGVDGVASVCFVNHCLCGTTDPGDYILLADTNAMWYDPNNPDQWVPHPEVASWPDNRKYWTSLFWALQVTTGIGNDIIPKSNMEIAFTVAMTIIGLMMYSVIIGAAASALQEMDTGSTERRQKLDEVTNYLRSRKVPAFMQKIIKDFYNHMWSVPGKRTDLFDDLPDKLRSRLEVVLNRDLIDRIPVLQYLPMNVYVDLVPRMQHTTFLPGEFAIRAGDLGDCLYFVQRGKVDAVLEDSRTVFLSMVPGEFFGEAALVWGDRHQCSYRAVDFIDLLQLSRSDYNDLEASAPAFCSEVQLTAMARRSTQMDAMITFERKKREEALLERVHGRQSMAAFARAASQVRDLFGMKLALDATEGEAESTSASSSTRTIFPGSAAPRTPSGWEAARERLGRNLGRVHPGTSPEQREVQLPGTPSSSPGSGSQGAPAQLAPSLALPAPVQLPLTPGSESVQDA